MGTNDANESEPPSTAASRVGANPDAFVEVDILHRTSISLTRSESQTLLFWGRTDPAAVNQTIRYPNQTLGPLFLGPDPEKVTTHTEVNDFVP